MAGLAQKNHISQNTILEIIIITRKLSRSVAAKTRVDKVLLHSWLMTAGFSERPR